MAATALIDAMCVSIELVDSRWTDGRDAPALAKLADLQRQSQALATTAKGGDEAATKAQFMKVAGACKACHDVYRAD